MNSTKIVLFYPDFLTRIWPKMNLLIGNCEIMPSVICVAAPFSFASHANHIFILCTVRCYTLFSFYLVFLEDPKSTGNNAVKTIHYWSGTEMDFFDFDDDHLIFNFRGSRSFTVHCIKTGAELCKLKATVDGPIVLREFRNGLLLTNGLSGCLRWDGRVEKIFDKALNFIFLLIEDLAHSKGSDCSCGFHFPDWVNSLRSVCLSSFHIPLFYRLRFNFKLKCNIFCYFLA